MSDTDPILTDMAKLAELPHDQKLQELSLYVADWFAAGKHNDDIARYLAAAGLTDDESRTLVADVYQNQKIRAANKQLSNARFGGLFALLGVVIFCTGLLSNLSLPRLIGAMLFVYGITRMMSRPTPLEDPEPTEPDSQIKS